MKITFSNVDEVDLTDIKAHMMAEFIYFNLMQYPLEIRKVLYYMLIHESNDQCS